ncbi:MAG: hypothetical protein HKN23_17820 [Verrucomicrobiales bacterium]|nr:hypothetical protein [Verrucomicrobiales bacterium]
MKRFIISAALIFSLAATSTTVAEERVWTRASDGKTVKGEFVKMKDEKTAIIKIGGADREFPVAMLSEADQKFLADQSKPADPAPAAPGDAKAAPAPAAKAAMPTGETIVTLSGVHLCCKDCEAAAIAALDNERLTIANKDKIKIEPDRGEGTIKVTAPSGKDAMDGLKALLQAGFYGKSDHDVVKYADIPERANLPTNTMTLRYLHICCRGCLRDFEKVIKSIDGIDEHNAKEGSSSVVLKGTSFKPMDVMTALREAGFGGSYQ